MQGHRISQVARPSGLPGSSNLMYGNGGGGGGGGGGSTSTYNNTFDLAGSNGPITSEQLPIGDQLMQVDQAITSTLQEIDANFAKTHQIITGQILPMIKRYGIASHNTWQGAKFWHKFFEAASDIQLAPPREESTFIDDDEQEDREGEGGDMDTTERGVNESDVLEDESFQTLTVKDLPRAMQYKKQFDNSYDLQDSSGELRSSHFEPPRVSDASVAATVRLSRTGLAASESRNGHQPFSGYQGDESDEVVAFDKGNGRTIKVHATPRRDSSKKNPFAKSQEIRDTKVSSSSSEVMETEKKDASPRWNGIADLRKTPLSHVNRSPVRKTGHGRIASNKKGKQREKGDEEEDEDSLAWPAGMSPPVTMQFSVPRSRYNKTPAKEAARLVVDDLLRTVEGATPAARRKLMEERKSANERGLSNNLSHALSRERPSNLVGTPLGTGKRRPNKGRTSMPTPPTVTKRVGGTIRISTSTQRESTPKSLGISEKAAPSTASRLMDEDEEGQSLANDVPEDLSTGLSRLAITKTDTADGMDRLFEEQIGDEDDSDNDMEDTDSEEEEEEYNGNSLGKAREASKQSGTGASHTSSSLASVSHSIDEDTLFGIRDPSLRAAQKSHGFQTTSVDQLRNHQEKPRNSSASSSNRFTSQASRAVHAPSSITAATPSTRMYKPMGQVANLGTVYRGRPLLGGEERDDTYSAPSPTPASLADGRSSFRRPQ